MKNTTPKKPLHKMLKKTSVCSKEDLDIGYTQVAEKYLKSQWWSTRFNAKYARYGGTWHQKCTGYLGSGDYICDLCH